MGDTPQLHDIHLPGNASFWPPASGWWLLLAIIFFLSIWLFLIVQKRNRIRQKKKIVLNRLDALISKIKKNPSNETLAEINTLLRQLAINTHSRADIASLTGIDWLEFLDKSGKTREFTRGAGRILIEAPYQAGNLSNLNLEEFIPLIRKWVSKTSSQAAARKYGSKASTTRRVNFKKTHKKWGGVS